MLFSLNIMGIEFEIWILKTTKTFAHLGTNKFRLPRIFCDFKQFIF